MSEEQRPSDRPNGAENLREEAPPGKRWKPVMLRWLKRLAWTSLVLGVVGIATVVGVIRYYESDLPSVEELRQGYDPPQVTRILARDGTLLASVFTERRTVIPLSEVPAHAKLAFLAAEDASFYEHKGLDYLGMLRALVANLRAGHTVQGGSTITQQVVKNLLLDSSRTYRRKIRETILARRLEQHLTKDEIFGLYLNHIYLGHGRYGVEEAARYYFGKKAKELSLPEAALLAGIVASPERLSPRNDAKKALTRRSYVLGQMLDKGFVTEGLYREALVAPLRLAPAAEGESELAPEVVTLVRHTLEATAGEHAKKGGFVVTTSIDPALQVAARKAVRDDLDRYMKRQKLAPPYTLEKRRLWGKAFEGTPKAYQVAVGRVKAVDDKTGSIDVMVGDTLGRVMLSREERFNPRHLPPSEFVTVGAALRVSLLEAPNGEVPVPLRLELGPEAALVSIDPRTRHVLALVGSYEAVVGGLDRATRARRQPGSSFKPFLYGYALHSRRVTPATLLELPASKDEKHPARKERVREALAKSDNAAAQKLLEEVGAANVVEFAHAAGIESRLEPTPSLALGAYEVRPIEIANAYATYASGGTYASPVLVTKIVGPDGKEVALPERPPTRRVLGEDEAYLITSLMRSVVTDGTGKRALALGRPVVGKTGTTNRAKDAWFVGYSTDLVAAVWVGYDDALPLGWGESGGVTALPAWVAFMKTAHEGKPAVEFARPPSVQTAKIDPASGLIAWPGQEDALDEVFLDGTVPGEAATPDAGVDASTPDAGADAAMTDPEMQQAAQMPDDGGAPAMAMPAPIEELPPF